MTLLVNTDCLEYLKTLEESSIDSLITDPPAGISFMNKEWDKDKGGRLPWIEWMTSVMQECFRVLKPGAHGLVWALPRTSHWTATALEDAGFEVRDVITHLFGSGFPKSLDISKAIDKAAGAERKVVGKIEPFGREGRKTDGFNNGVYGENMGIKAGLQNVTAPSTPEAIQWQGWGTALKPASEHWILIRKPLSEKTVAANVLKHGTGGINIDSCRITSPDHPGVHHAGSSGSGSLNWNSGDVKDSSKEYYTPQGRFPANLVLDEEAAEMLDEQSGVLKTGGSPASPHNKGKFSKNGMFAQGDTNISDSNFAGDSGGASRFFYVAKASKREKNEGLEGMPEVNRGTFDGNIDLENARKIGANPEKTNQPAANHHPTVKPLKLMEYLITLITPPSGTVLDPFMGSGSTGVAAKRLGFKFIGIEKEKEYFEIAEKRVS